MDLANYSPFSSSPVSLARVYSHRPDGRALPAPVQSLSPRSGAEGAVEVPQPWGDEVLSGVGTYSRPARLGCVGRIIGITFSFTGGKALCFGRCVGRPESLKLEPGEHVRRIAGRTDASRGGGGSPCLVMLQITTSNQREHIFGLLHRTRSCSPFSYAAPWGEEIVAVRLSPTGVSALLVCGVETRQLASLLKPNGAALKVVQPSSLPGGVRTRLFEDDSAAQRELDDAASRLGRAMRTLEAQGGHASDAGAEAALGLPSPPQSGAGGVPAAGEAGDAANDAPGLAQTDEEHSGDVGSLPQAIAEAVQSIAAASQHLKRRHERQTCKVRPEPCPRFLQARFRRPRPSAACARARVTDFRFPPSPVTGVHGWPDRRHAHPVRTSRSLLVLCPPAAFGERLSHLPHPDGCFRPLLLDVNGARLRGHNGPKPL
jgi:hypothetical protein